MDYFDRENNHLLYGDKTDTIIFEDDLFECFLVGDPRAEGHVAISTKKHFKDMMDIDDVTCERVFKFSKKAMNAIREVYNSESVYLCTMCDGPMNHFHIQLIQNRYLCLLCRKHKNCFYTFVLQ